MRRLQVALLAGLLALNTVGVAWALDSSIPVTVNVDKTDLGTADITVSPASLDFHVLSGQYKDTKNVTITSNSTGNVQVDGSFVMGSDSPFRFYTSPSEKDWTSLPIDSTTSALGLDLKPSSPAWKKAPPAVGEGDEYYFYSLTGPSHCLYYRNPTLSKQIAGADLPVLNPASGGTPTTIDIPVTFYCGKLHSSAKTATGTMTFTFALVP